MDVGEIFTLDHFKNLFASYYCSVHSLQTHYRDHYHLKYPSIYLNFHYLTLIVDGSKSYINSLALKGGPESPDPTKSLSTESVLIEMRRKTHSQNQSASSSTSPQASSSKIPRRPRKEKIVELTKVDVAQMTNH